MKLRTYLPTLPQVSRETFAILGATIISAWIISRIPAVRDLVRGSSLN